MLDNAIAVINTLAIVVGSVGAIIFWRVRKRKEVADASQIEASAADVITEAARKLIEPLSDRISELEATNRRLEREVCELRERVERFAKDEAAYQAELHEKNVEIKVLHAELAEAKEERDELVDRVVHLEDVIKRNHLNGE